MSTRSEECYECEGRGYDIWTSEDMPTCSSCGGAGRRLVDTTVDNYTGVSDDDY